MKIEKECMTETNPMKAEKSALDVLMGTTLNVVCAMT